MRAEPCLQDLIDKTVDEYYESDLDNYYEDINFDEECPAWVKEQLDNDEDS